MTSVACWLVDAPWRVGACLSALPRGDTGDLAVQGNGSPVLLSTEHPRLTGAYGRPPVAGFPVFLPGRRQITPYHLPVPSHVTATQAAEPVGLLQLGGPTRPLLQPGALPRTPLGGEGAGDEHSLAWLIHWMTHTLQELAQDSRDEDAVHFRGLVRRDWSSITSQVLNPGLSEPRMELIIRIAQDDVLQKVLSQVAHQPRLVLKRIRDQVAVGRIQELDAACIRDYARRPGRTTVEKAGSRQKLLAVKRQTSADTLENRVARWCYAEIADYGAEWLAMNGRYAASASARFKLVRRLRERARSWANSESLQEVPYGGLSHPVAANYPLQLETRYRRIYKTYLELCRRNKFEEDAWTWRRRLWADMVRLLLGSALFQLCEDKLSANGQSDVYFNEGPERGTWLNPGSSPGPFLIGKGWISVIDANDLTPVAFDRWDKAAPTPGLGEIGRLGPEIVLYHEDTSRSVLCWPIQALLNEDEQKKMCDEAASHLEAHMRAHKQAFGSMVGLIITSHARSDGKVRIMESNQGQGRVVLVSLPSGISGLDAAGYKAVVEEFILAVGIALRQMGMSS